MYKRQEVTDAYLKYTGMLKDMIKRGFSAGVYTQTSDVEIEVNGLMTYDRKLIKVDEAKISALKDVYKRQGISCSTSRSAALRPGSSPRGTTARN